jgi:adenylate kinase
MRLTRLFFVFITFTMLFSGVAMASDSKYRAFVVFGPPGSGKGTIGHLLAEAGQQLHLSSGDLFRNLPPDSEEAKELRSYMNSGTLAPDDLAIRIFAKHMDRLVAEGKFDPKHQVVFLDGIPRTKYQAEVLEKYVEIEKVVVLEVPKEVLIERLLERGTIQGRSDDQDRAVLETRMDVYQKQTAEVLDHYSSSKIVKINGHQSRLQVLRDVLLQIANRV